MSHTTIRQALEFLGLEYNLEAAKQLGSYASQLSRDRKVMIHLVPVEGQTWSQERAYSADIIKDACSLHPYTHHAYKALTSEAK